MSVMNAVTMVVDSLDDSPKLVSELKNLGKNHGRHNIKVDNFRVRKIAFLSFNQTTPPFLVD